ncbi:hypothetical protein KC959_02080 [Candidatus Saccharibacteria bacterium]|nr:hypothetical protein [Candidatus Saccharibacteria bacterium]
MIQFNLLPDVKKDYVKAKRAKRLIVTSSIFASGASIAVVLLLFSVVQIAQKKHIRDLTNDIKSAETRIQSIDGVNKVLTVQNQLTELPSLHENKPETSRIFSYLTFVSPSNLTVSALDMSVTDSILTLQGSADTIATVNTFVDNLKATQYQLKGADESTLAAPFSKINTQLSGDNEGASFKISLTFDPIIFNNTQEIIMKIGAQSFDTSAGEQQ